MDIEKVIIIPPTHTDLPAIRRVETWQDGVCVNIHEEEFKWDGQFPLDTNGVFATLNAVLGIWPVEDAANAVGLPVETLVLEAQAWAVAGDQ